MDISVLLRRNSVQVVMKRNKYIDKILSKLSEQTICHPLHWQIVYPDTGHVYAEWGTSAAWEIAWNSRGSYNSVLFKRRIIIFLELCHLYYFNAMFFSAGFQMYLNFTEYIQSDPTSLETLTGRFPTVLYAVGSRLRQIGAFRPLRRAAHNWDTLECRG